MAWKVDIFPTAKDRKQIRNVAIVLNGCAGTTLSRQFKKHATVSGTNHNARKFHMSVLIYNLFVITDCVTFCIIE
jgi:hypothetical protein